MNNPLRHKVRTLRRMARYVSYNVDGTYPAQYDPVMRSNAIPLSIPV